MKIDKEKLLKMGLTLLGILLLVAGFRFFNARNSLTLSEYAAQNPEANMPVSEETLPSVSAKDTPQTSTDPEKPETDPAKQEKPDSDREATGAETIGAEATDVETTGAETTDAGEIPEERITYQPSFYYEPLSDDIKEYITGISYPDTSESTEKPEITFDELSYVHILHYNFDGYPAQGELICNTAIAQDLTEIFYELYVNEYRLEKVRLIDEYNGDDTASMEDNNTSCFNYRTVDNSTHLSKHAFGLAIDINPLYNPYITYGADGSERVSPEASLDYADRSASFPYKIDENDLCYKLFKEHGFTWGGNWNSSKDYQHFQKTLTE